MANESSIPGWVFEHRKSTCFNCSSYFSCKDKLNIVKRNFICPLGKIKLIDDLIADKAWPDSIDKISGCCDSAMQY